METMPQGLPIHDWVAHEKDLTTRKNIVDVWYDGDTMWKPDVWVSTVGSERDEEFIRISGESNEVWKKHYRLFIRTR